MIFSPTIAKVIFTPTIARSIFTHTIDRVIFTPTIARFMLGFGLWCLTPLSTIFQLNRGGVKIGIQ
jgi:hypothetical protein